MCVCACSPLFFMYWRLCDTSLLKRFLLLYMMKLGRKIFCCYGIDYLYYVCVCMCVCVCVCAYSCPDAFLVYLLDNGITSLHLQFESLNLKSVSDRKTDVVYCSDFIIIPTLEAV